MPKEFICTFTKEDLERLYFYEGLTIKQMCHVVGCKSDITMAKILKKNGIDTNSNSRLAFVKRGNRTDEEFKSYLQEEYVDKKRSANSISKELGISQVIVRRYLVKYGIPVRTKSEQQVGERAVNWTGGRHLASSGYIELYMPDYPHQHRPNYIYEHIYVAEQTIGRLLRKDEAVHHINGIKTDNRAENLLVLTKSEHSKLHSRQGELRKKGVGRS